MRVAFVGKGGSGKSAIAGTFARLLARRGEPVLAVDSDPMPGLAFSLGLDIDDAPIPDEAVQERPEGEEGPRYRLVPGLTAADAVERYAATAPDGVRFLQLGKLRGHASSLIRSQFALRQIMEELPEGRWSIVGDLPGGTRQLFFGWGDYAHTLVAVVEPTATSLLAVRRLARFPLSDGGPTEMVAVVNKVRSSDDVELVRRRTGLEVVGAVPWDEELAAAEREGQAPIDRAPGSRAIEAVGSLITYLYKGG
ncbi:MAG: hypothetical protein ACRD0U_09245 [Acidimicrobiales bacterium]